MTNSKPSASCDWPAVSRKCGACGELVGPEDGASYVARQMRAGWYWSWRCVDHAGSALTSGRIMGAQWRMTRDLGPAR